MPLRIGTNVTSIFAQRQLASAEARSSHAIKALSSGQRIVTAGDDAANFAISEELRGRLTGLQRAKMNAESAKSMIQVAEGGLNEQFNILVRLRELGVQAASDGVSDRERTFLNEEFIQLKDEFDRIAATTAFGSNRLLVGSGEKFDFLIGTNSGPENQISISLDADTTASTVGINKLSIDDQDDAADTLEDLDDAISKLAGVRASFGALQSRFQFAISNLEVQHENIAAARSRIADADIAYETAELVQNQILQEVGVAVLAQANATPRLASRLLI